MSLKLRLSAAWALPLLLAACGRPSVVRLQGGELAEGRAIPARAYAAYARGALFEAAGEFGAAASAYQAAALADSDGPEPWTRLGAMLCRLGRPADAALAFEQAEATDPAFGELAVERARCAPTTDAPEHALELAERALIAAPDSEQALLLYAKAKLRLGGEASARAALWARLLSHPAQGGEVLREFRTLAERAGDGAALRWIADRSSAWNLSREALPQGEVSSAGLDAQKQAARVALGRALSEGRPIEAGSIVRTGLSQTQLALWALALGRSALAEELAIRVLKLTPTDPDAQIALMAARDLRSRAGLAVDALPAPALPTAAPANDSEPRAPSRLGRLVLAELLVRHGVTERTALGPGDIDAADGPAERAVSARLGRKDRVRAP